MNTNTGQADIRKQEYALLMYMKTHTGVTRAVAMNKLRIANVPEIIRRLKEHGHVIEGEWCERIASDGTKKRYKRYYLIKEAG